MASLYLSGIQHRLLQIEHLRAIVSSLESAEPFASLLSTASCVTFKYANLLPS